MDPKINNTLDGLPNLLNFWLEKPTNFRPSRKYYAEYLQCLEMIINF